MSEAPGFPVYKLSARGPEGEFTAITFLSPEDLAALGGLPARALVGRLVNPAGDLVPGNFEWNRAFVEWLHGVIRREVPDIPEFVEAARRVPSGWLHIHDARAYGGRPEAEERDIIGSFRVEAGVLVADSYRPNPAHRILTAHGMFMPHPLLRDRILAAMRGAPAAR